MIGELLRDTGILCLSPDLAEDFFIWQQLSARGVSLDEAVR